MLNLYEYQNSAEFSQKHLLSLAHLSQDEIFQIISLGLKLKIMQKENKPHPMLQGKTLGMIFQKSSTRTRVSFEVGMYQLGGYALFLNTNDIQLGRGETIEDTAKVLSRYLDGIMIRTFNQKDVEELAKYGTIPVINGLTDLLHPCQILADLMTIYERKERFAGLKLAFIGDGNNVSNSLLLGCAKVGMDIAIACPKAYMPNREIFETARKTAVENKSKVYITDDPKKAVTHADVIYTDVWASMGQENESEKRIKEFVGFQVNDELFARAHKDAIFLHCLPAHRGEEVTAEIIDGPNSAVFDEAENRLHIQKAIMVLLMGDKQS